MELNAWIRELFSSQANMYHPLSSHYPHYLSTISYPPPLLHHPPTFPSPFFHHPPVIHTKPLTRHTHSGAHVHMSFLVIIIVFVIVVHVHILYRYIMLSSPQLNNVAIVGCVLVYLAVFFLGFDDSSLEPESYPFICTVSTTKEPPQLGNNPQLGNPHNWGTPTTGEPPQLGNPHNWGNSQLGNLTTGEPYMGYDVTLTLTCEYTVTSLTLCL